MSSISTSSFYGRKKLDSSHFKQKNAIVDFNVSDKEEDNEDIRDEIDDIGEEFNKRSDDEWSEPSDTNFLDENNSSSSDTESDQKSSAGTSTTQNLTVNSQNTFRWRKKTYVVLIHHSKENIFLLLHWILYHLITIIKSFLMIILLNTLQNKQIFIQFKLVVNR